MNNHQILALMEAMRSQQQQQHHHHHQQQQQQQQQPSVGFREEDTSFTAGFDAQRFFEEDWQDDRHHEPHTEITPVPINTTHQIGLPPLNIDLHILEDLYKSLSQGYTYAASNQQNTVEAANTNGIASHILDSQTMQQVQQMNAFYALDSNHQMLTHHLTQQQEQLSLTQQQLQQQGTLPSFDFINLLQYPHCQDAQATQADGSIMMHPISLQSNSIEVATSQFNPAAIHPVSLQVSKETTAPLSHPAIIQPQETKPVKALSAYNFFFRYERERILNGCDEDYSASKQEELLTGHWFRDRTKKRRHRKTHGKIAFTTLSRMVSQRWKALPQNRKDFFIEVANKDLGRYRSEVDQLENGCSVIQ